jgi:TetR/AcrR family transcriptional regulator
VSDRLDEILDAAYRCLRRSGVRRTTMDDIGKEMGTSRTLLYQYVRNTEDAFQRLAQRFLDEALLASRRAIVQPDAPLATRVARALEVKLNLSSRVWSDAPEHAAEFLGEHARLSAGMTARYNEDLKEILAEALREHLSPSDVEDVSKILLALTRGLEPGGVDSDAIRLLHKSVGLMLGDLTMTPNGSAHD